MLSVFKKFFYFHLASYFKFFAAIRLRRWNPKVIVVTGSNGKTTLLHMLDAQLGEKAKVSHHANSAFGVPFDILGLHRESMQDTEWFDLFLKAPQKAFGSVPKEKIYIVEADADRPGEGKFLAELLKPEVVLWVSVGRTHSMHFDTLVADKSFKTVEEAIAYEFGYFIEHATELVILNGDSSLQSSQTYRTKAQIESIKKSEALNSYDVTKEGTTFTLTKQKYLFSGLLPEEVYLSIAMCKKALEHIDEHFDPKFHHFVLPPGRGTILQGKNHSIVVDSTYNGNLGSIKAMLAMFRQFPHKKKWLILGDMKELGEETKEEHEKLAKLINAMEVEKVVLVGSLVQEFTLPLVEKDVVGFATAPDALLYIREHLSGGEGILLKGSASVHLEGIVEKLLAHTKDAELLPRQTDFWKKKREGIGFPEIDSDF